MKALIPVIPAGARTRAAAKVSSASIAMIPFMRVSLCNTDREHTSRD
jgi:hypothetical protein